MQRLKSTPGAVEINRGWNQLELRLKSTAERLHNRLKNPRLISTASTALQQRAVFSDVVLSPLHSFSLLFYSVCVCVWFQLPRSTALAARKLCSNSLDHHTHLHDLCCICHISCIGIPESHSYSDAPFVSCQISSQQSRRLSTSAMQMLTRQLHCVTSLGSIMSLSSWRHVQTS